MGQAVQLEVVQASRQSDADARSAAAAMLARQPRHFDTPDAGDSAFDQHAIVQDRDEVDALYQHALSIEALSSVLLASDARESEALSPGAARGLLLAQQLLSRSVIERVEKLANAMAARSAN